MKKILKVIIIIAILISTAFMITQKYSFAANDLNENTTTSSGQITTTVSSTSSSEDEILSIKNIINILLIAIGIVIILLAIAILIRLKK